MKQKMEQPKAISCSSSPNHKPHFFKFLFPNPFANLRIPKNFYKHLPAVPPKSASLVTQTDKFWRVDVCQNEEGICFSRGWPEFAKAHDLQLGYLVVFRYEGKMVFNVQVFDTTSCLKDYSLTPSKFVDLTSSDVKIKSEGETQTSVASGRKRRNATDKAQFIDLLSDVNIKSEGETQIPVTSGRKRRNATGKAQFINLPSDVNINSKGETQTSVASGRKRRNATGKAQFIDLPSDVNIKSEGETQIPVASGRKRRNATGKAQFINPPSDVNIKSEGETQIPVASGRKRRNATGKAQFINLPSDVNIKSEGETQIPVASGRKRRNATGKAQFINLPSDVNIKSEGMTQIPVASGRKRKITTGKAELIGEEDGEEGEPILKKHRVQKKMIQKSSLNMPTVPQFEKKLDCTSTTKYRKALYIPKRFCVENGLLSERTMFLKNSKEKKWQVKFSIRRYVGQFTAGWSAFSRENRLRKGDECIFQLINKNTFLVNVVNIND